jgi:D-alanyl-D-alanine carboxypeptidase/D-alanyl-D-alanine-endopeptidase (penicillin-binding protein 4)
MIPSRLRRLPALVLVAVMVELAASAGVRATPAERAPRPAPGAAQPALASEINAIIQGGNAENAFWGIQIRALDTGEVLYEHNPQQAFLPASNMKLFTSATALAALGPEHRYKTTLYFDGEIDGSVMRGDLILKGTGDPTFGSSEVPSAGDPLARWAQALAQMGVTRVDGRLIGDDDALSDRFYAEGWGVDYITEQSSRLIGVSASGLAYRDNLIRVKIRSGEAGAPPQVTTRPRGYLDVVNRATTSARQRGRALDIRRSFGQEQITLTGSVPSTYASTFFVPVSDPTRYVLRSFRANLQQAGIGTEEMKLVDLDGLDEEARAAVNPAENARPLFVHYSPTLAKILRTVNKESNNFYADQVFRSFSASGTANASENRVKTLLEEAGASTEAISIRDGSGLSRKDLVTPAATAKLLDHMASHSASEAFRASLARGGEPETTLQYRLRGQSVRAKTGSLEFARALSGYATLSSGRKVAFALLANNYAGPSYEVTQTFDRIVRAMTS